MSEPFQDPYCYPGTNVLINKFGEKDLNKLQEIERNLTTLRLIELKMKPIEGKFDFEHLKKIHHYIFNDIYEWAGQVRTVEIRKHDWFCYVQLIDSQQKYIFDQLRNENHLKGMSKEKFAERGAYYLGEINDLHPFREGNGRTQREFMRELALNAGYNLDLDSVPKEYMIFASRESYKGNYKEFERIIKNNLKPLDLKKDPYDIKFITENFSKKDYGMDR